MDESVVKHFEQKLGVLTLSAAIRRGAKMYPQARGNYFEYDSACAIGAAWVGAGYNPEIITGSRARRALGISKRLHDKIVQRNDDWKWSRERIAAWLESKGL